VTTKSSDCPALLMHNKPASLVIEVAENTNWVGGSVYIENLLSTLSVLPVASRPHVYLQFMSSPKSPVAKRLLGYPIVQNKAGRNDVLSEILAVMRRMHRGVTYRYPWINYLARTSHDKLFFPSFDTTQRRRKNLYWIPDFQHHHLPELFSRLELERRNQCYEGIAQAEGILLLSSKAALEDFHTYYPNAQVEARVWSFCSDLSVGASSDCYKVLERYNLPEKFLYVANQFWKHKDHVTVFEALRLLHENGLEIPIVCTGKQEDPRDPGYFPALRESLHTQGIQQVYFLGVIPRDEQVQLFRVAAAIVQPSRFEGWSTVIEDAKDLGRTIIASDIDVHKEQLMVVDNANLFRVSDAKHLAEVIATLWADLRSGPDSHLEMLAAERNSVRRLALAHQFVAIFDEAMVYSQRIKSINRKQL